MSVIGSSQCKERADPSGPVGSGRCRAVPTEARESGGWPAERDMRAWRQALELDQPLVAPDLVTRATNPGEAPRPLGNFYRKKRTWPCAIVRGAKPPTPYAYSRRPPSICGSNGGAPVHPFQPSPRWGEEQNPAHQSGTLIFQIRRGSTFSVNMRNDEWLSGAQSK